MKICYVTDLFPPCDKGGAEIIAHSEAMVMAKSGHDVCVVTTQPMAHRTEPMYVCEERGNLRIYSFDPSGFPLGGVSPYGMEVSRLANLGYAALEIYNSRSRRIVEEILRREQPDIVHAHSIPWISYGAMQAIDRNRTKYVQSFHTYIYECPKGGLLRRGLGNNRRICQQSPFACQIHSHLFRRAMPPPACVIATSRFTEKRLSQIGYQNVFYLPNGVKTPAQVGNQRNKEFLFIARLTRDKGGHELIEAFGRAKLHDFTLRVIGDGEELAALQEQAAPFPNIVFSGRVPHAELGEFYQSCWAVVVPSIWYEVLSTVVCEAMAHGRPVIATDIPGTRDQIIDSETGFLYQIGDIDHLAAFLGRIARDEGLANEMGRRGRERSVLFSEEHHANQLERIYGTLLQ